MPRQTSNRLSSPEINTLGVAVAWRRPSLEIPSHALHNAARREALWDVKRTSLSAWRFTMSSKKLRIARSAQTKALDLAVTDTWKDQDAYLDEALRETMPASDPISPGRVHRVARKDSRSRLT
jgi:hypothetical protein